MGTVCWGHDTDVIEDNVRDFNVNWTGTGAIENPGSDDIERLALEAGEYMISEIVNTGVKTVQLLQNYYAAGDTVNLDYRHAAAQGDIDAAEWIDYTDPFVSLGFVQIKVTSTL